MIGSSALRRFAAFVTLARSAGSGVLKNRPV